MKALVGIKSCWRYTDRREACRNTWLPDCPFEWNFFVGGHKPRKPFGSTTEQLYGESDVVSNPHPDDFKTIGPKIARMCEWASRESADFLVVMDDDTYMRPQRAWQLMDRLKEVGGHVAAYMRVDPTYPQGSFYILRPKAYEILASHPLLDVVSAPDDVLVGRILSGYRDIVWHHSPEIQVGPRWKDGYPTAQNQIVSTHKCLAGDMKLVHALWRASNG